MIKQKLPRFGTASAQESRESFRVGIARCHEGRYMAIVGLTDLERTGGYRELGHGSVHCFAAQEAGLSRREVNGMLRVGRALSTLAKVDECFRSGRLCWSKVRLIASVATPETEEAWIDKAERLTSTQLEHEVSSRTETVLPSGHVALPSVPHATFLRMQQLFREVRSQLRQPHLSDNYCLEHLLQLAEQQLNEELPTDSDSPIPPQWTRPVPAETAPPTSRSIPRATARTVFRRSGYTCESRGCANTQSLELHHILPFANGGDHTPTNLRVLCARCHDAHHAANPPPAPT